MTQTELLLDALEYYTIDPVGRRCIGVDEIGLSTCYYSPKSISKQDTSQRCLIGRLLNPDLAELIDTKESEIGINTLISNGLYTLPSFMNGDNKYFLCDCQSLHDGDRYWTETGLSEYGKTRVSYIIDEHNLDKELFSKFLN
jgi:hypothetical protein